MRRAESWCVKNNRSMQPEPDKRTRNSSYPADRRDKAAAWVKNATTRSARPPESYLMSEEINIPPAPPSLK
jgi:hypothetical protein